MPHYRLSCFRIELLPLTLSSLIKRVVQIWKKLELLGCCESEENLERLHLCQQCYASCFSENTLGFWLDPYQVVFG